MYVASAIVGVLLVALALSIAIWTAGVLRRRGEPTRVAWVHLVQSPTLWFGVVLLLSTFSPWAAGAVLAMLVLFHVTFLIVLLIRGVRGLPEFVRRVRSIGDPAAWRGESRCP